MGRDLRNARAPQGLRIFAVGDIHGRLDLLEQLVCSIRRDAEAAGAAQNVLIFLGDYVDRGPDAKGVIEFLLSLDMPTWRTIFLRGNHDQSMLDFFDEPKIYSSWRNYGGQQTLLSYGVRPPRFDDETEFKIARDEFLIKCPPSHLQFLKSLKFHHVEGDYIFVHAGVRPGISLNSQRNEDLLWIRDDFLFSEEFFEKVVVHGHTPVERPVRRPNRIGLDTGAYATGRLTAAVFKDDECNFLMTRAEPLATVS
jgi:serine/threonine protein phosphatase 1